MATFQKITPNLWFSSEAELAVEFYTNIFRNAATGTITHYGKEGYEFHHMPEGAVMTIAFTLEGQQFLALNGGPAFKFNEAISFIINCRDQEEVDYYWEKLSESGDPAAQMCGWLKDKFGVSWQIIPVQLTEMISSGQKELVSKAMNALMKMKKIDIATLEKAQWAKD